MSLIRVIFVCLVSLAVADPNRTEVIFKNKSSTFKLFVTFEAFTPQGLRVSVPNSDGIELFSFHAKSKLPLRNGEDGTLTWQVVRPNGSSITMDFPKEQLLTGDIINCWARIQRNGMSIRSESFSHIVRADELKIKQQKHVSKAQTSMNLSEPTSLINYLETAPYEWH